MNQRFKQMIKVLSAYAAGNFNSNMKTSDRYDELDAIAESINMVGQELKAVTISRDYFNNIFHSVSDMIFVLTRRGEVMDINRRVNDLLGYKKEDLLSKKLDELIKPRNPSVMTDILTALKQPGVQQSKDYHLNTAFGKPLPVQISASYLAGDRGKSSGILLIIKDRTYQIESKNRVIRAIIDTQENERKRLAQDLHDSLGQELVGVKFYISSVSESSTNPAEKKILAQSDKNLEQIICDMRDICFNLLPRALQDFGLLKAVKELCIHTRTTHKVEFQLETDEFFPDLPMQVSVDLYRVIQEFINNATRHGRCTVISMKFKHYPDHVFIGLHDNGKGFSPGKVMGGMGLQSVQSRISSHKGEVTIKSYPGRGTKFEIILPITG